MDLYIYRKNMCEIVNLYNIANFCLKSNLKIFTPFTRFSNIIIPNDLFTKNSLTLQEIIHYISERINNISYKDMFIINLCDNNIDYSYLILETFKSKYIIELYFGIFSEELLSPLVISSDDYGVKYIVNNLFYGKPKLLNNEINQSYMIISNLLLYCKGMNNEIRYFIFDKAYAFFNKMFYVLKDINSNKHLSQIHETIPYLFIVLFMNNYDIVIWGKLIKFLIENNLWKILDNINFTLKRNKFNVKNFYSFIIRNIILTQNISFSFLSDNIITINTFGVNIKDLTIFDDILKVFPRSTKINNFIKYHSQTDFNIKISGLNK
jgi:hypothetical protein